MRIPINTTQYNGKSGQVFFPGSDGTGLKLLSTLVLGSRGAPMLAAPVRPAVPVVEGTCRCGMCCIACLTLFILCLVLC